MNSLKQQTVVVIGGSSGIGFEVAKMAATDGANLILVGRHADRLATAKAQLNQYPVTVDTKIVDAHDHDALEVAFNELPEFDHLVSMVGDVMGGGFLDAEMSVIRHVLESKFFTNVKIGQLAAKKIKQGGSLVFTSGTGGRAQNACASYIGNMGINALVEGLAVELAPKARVNAVSPTWTLTTFWRDVPQEQVVATKAYFESAIPMKRLAAIEELASTYIYLMQNGFITGQHIAVDGGVMLGQKNG